MNDGIIKCVVVGDGAVGKTCMLIVATQNTFPTDYVPTVFDNYPMDIMVNGQEYELTLFDTAGQEDYDKLRPMSYDNTDVFLLCFSIAEPDSLSNVKVKWIKELSLHCPKTPVVLVGTQMDLRDCEVTKEKLLKRKMAPVSRADGDRMKKDLNAFKYVECSAKTQVLAL